MKCSDCRLYKTEGCRFYTSGEDYEAAELLTCFALKNLQVEARPNLASLRDRQHLEVTPRRVGASKQACWRRGISLAMLIFGLQAMLTGVWQLFPPFNKQIDPLHLMPAFIFGLLLIVHVWLNRKPLFRYFDKLGWRWVFIALGAMGIIWAGIIMPIVMVGQR